MPPERPALPRSLISGHLLKHCNFLARPPETSPLGPMIRFGMYRTATYRGLIISPKYEG